MEPNNRDEMFLAQAGGQTIPDLEPQTRKEMLLAKAAGKTVPEVEPSTREEWFISQIKSGGASLPRKAINFLSKDALVTLAYTKQEFLALTEMPDLPEVPGMVGRGWDWSIADARAYLTTHDTLDIAPTYQTEDGKTTVTVITEDIPGGSAYPGIVGAFGTISGTDILNGRYLSGIKAEQSFYPKTKNLETPVYDMSKPWHLHLRVKNSTLDNKRRTLFAGTVDYSLPGGHWGNSSDTYLFWCGYSTTGVNPWNYDFFIPKSMLPFTANTWYDVDYLWDGTNASFSMSDGTTRVTKSATNVPQFYQASSGYLQMGAWQGSVSSQDSTIYTTFDLANCYWKQDGVTIWGNNTDNTQLPVLIYPGIVGDMTANQVMLTNGRYLGEFKTVNKVPGTYTPKTIDNQYPSYDMSKPWHIHLKAKCSALTNGIQALIGHGVKFQYGPTIQFADGSASDLIYVGYSTDGNDWTSTYPVSKAELPFSADTWYTFDYGWDGQNVTFTVTDGTTTVTKSGVSSAFYQAPASNIACQLGTTGSDKTFAATNCTFDLADCYWEQDGEILWGNKAE